MKIAVTYENGEVFQHFGHSENIKLYEVEDNKVVKSEVISTNGQGHGAIGGLLKDNLVNVLICGGLGSGAKDVLKENNIEVYSGVIGNADEAVNALLNGTLEYNNDITCNHHHEEKHDCSHHDCKVEKGGCSGNK